MNRPWTFLTSQIRYKIILPYLGLTILVMVLGALIVSALTQRNTQQGFRNQLIQAGISVNEALVRHEADKLLTLRNLALSGPIADQGIEAVAVAVATGNRSELARAVRPAWDVAVGDPQVLADQLAIVDADGRLLLAWQQPGGQPAGTPPIQSEESSFATLPALQDVLNGVSDPLGDKFSGITAIQLDATNPNRLEYYFYTVVPVPLTENGVTRRVGAMVMATQLDRLVAALQQRSSAIVTVVYDYSGHVIGSAALPTTNLTPLQLAPETLQQIEQGIALGDQNDFRDTVFSEQVGGRNYQFAYGPLRIRQTVVGYVGVALSSDFAAQTVRDAQFAIVAITVLLMASSIVIGWLIAQSITVPLRDLVYTAEAVRGGNLEQRSRLRSQDELGTLADAFNQMTEYLLRLYVTSRELSASLQVERVLATTEHAAAQLVPETRAMALLAEDNAWRLLGTGLQGERRVEAEQLHITSYDPVLAQLAGGYPCTINGPTFTFDGAPTGSENQTERSLLARGEILPSQDGLVNQLAVATGFQSMLLTPLLMESVLGGVLVIGHHARDAFVAAKEQALRATSNMAATVLTNAVLYQRVQEEASERQAILQSIGDGVVVLDETRHVALVNRTAETMLQLEDWRKRRIHFSEIQLERVPLTREMFERDELVEHYRLGDRVMSMSSATVVGADGRVHGEVVVMHDISAEARIDQAKNDFIATISHELRTPLTVIRGWIDMLQRGYCGPLNADQSEAIETVSLRTNEITEKVQNVITVADIESGRFEPEPEPVSLATAVLSILAEMRRDFDAKNISLVVDVPDDLPMVMVDRRQLKIILKQLLDNAYRYTEQGTVTIRGSTSTTHVVIDITDTGPGILPEQFDRLFKRFYRVEGNNSTIRGSGLGLAITRQLVERQGGRVWVTSTPGAGSQFSFSLPKASEPVIATQER